MRDFAFQIFGDRPCNDVTKIYIFSWTHIFYLLLMIASVVVLTILFRKKSMETKVKVLDIIAILITVSYIGDFFAQPFYNNGTMLENGEIILDKFPFHICTILCPLILFSRYSKHKEKIKTPIAVLAIVAPLIWLIYPGTALNESDKSAFCYRIMQLFVYHGLVFIYGSVYVLLQEQKLDIKKCYKEAIFVLLIALWATLGNSLYSCEHSYNWFFLKDPVFDFIPKSINPFVVIVIIYLSCLFIYGINYLVKYLYSKRKSVVNE